MGAVSDSQHPYPPDQFDQEADAAAFHGAHRAEEPFWRQNLIYIIIIAAAVVTLVVLLFLIGGMGGGGGDDRADDPTTAAETEATEEEAGAAEEEAAEEPAEEPDFSTPILVVNAGGINGMAGAWEEHLTEAGWEDIGVSTADNRQQEPVVFYRSEEDAASAQALADQVGAGDARQSDEYDATVTFVAVEMPAEGEDGDAGGEGEGEG